MPETRKCPECGAELPGESAGGFCVMCGLRDALEASDEHSSATPAEPVANPSPTLRIEPSSEKPGDRIGRYKLLQEIGVGGMGSVWMAEQEEPVRRKVALKVIKLGMDTKQVIGRFEAERQALALMDHPNIAKVLDAGATDAGRPFFVMELVRGIPITDYCDKNTLSSGDRLELFVQVCHAIQHAHQKGIIHRDIKPSNILVANHDGTPMPKVIDFGIAKATTDQRLTDKTLFTAFQQFLGTPAYMSPEQAEMSALDVDTRSDIYSLGVLLYELLTGQTPFEARRLLQAGLDEMRRIIREEEPVRPSTRISTLDVVEQTAVAKQRHCEPPKLVGLMRGDLDWIVMKALEKDRSRRYETANSLATDIERHLRNEPVTARPPSQLYRFQKLVRRNQLAFAAATALLVVLLIGLGTSTYLYVREKRAERAAQIEAEKSREVAQFLKNTLESITPEMAFGLDTTLLHNLLDKAAERIQTSLTNQPQVEAELWDTVGRAYNGIGDFAKSEAMYRHAIKLRRERFGTQPDALATSLGGLGWLLLAANNPAEAEKQFREALAIRRNLFPSGHPNLAESLHGLSAALVAQGKLTEAEVLQQEALAMQRKFLGEQNEAVASSLRGLGVIRRLQGRHAEAEALMVEELAIMRKVGSGLQVAFSLTELSSVYVEAGKPAEAEAAQTEALTIQRKIYGRDHPALMNTLVGLTGILNRKHKPAEAEVFLREAIAIQRVHPSDKTDLAMLVSWLGGLLQNQGKLAEAEQWLREAIAIQKVHPSDKTDLAMLISWLGGVLRDQGKLAEAEQNYREAVAIQSKRYGDDSPAVGAALNSLAGLLERQGKVAEAETSFREAARRGDVGALNGLAWRLATGPDSKLRNGAEAVVFAEKAVAATNRKDPMILDTLAAAYAEVGQFDKAVPVQQEAIALLPNEEAKKDYVFRLKFYESGSPFRDHRQLAELTSRLLAEGKFTEAESPARECLAIREKTMPDDWLTFNGRSMLGGSLLVPKKYDEAEPLLLSGYEGMKQREDKIPASGKPRLKEALQRLVHLYEQTNRPDLAAEWQKKLAEFDQAATQEKSAAPQP